MHRRIFLAAALSASMFLAACAGRAPQPIDIVQADDRNLSCAQLVAEVQSNNAQIAKLAEEQGWKVGQNVAAGVAGLVIPVLWFGMDFQDAAGKEARALSQRNGYLADTAAKRGCNVGRAQTIAPA
ncbi:MAG: hypothetical protein AAFR60_00200 [Pseudomonadota bacterium]